MNGYDVDGTLTSGVVPEEPYVIISGRTWAEPTPEIGSAKALAVRGVGDYGDREAAARFKAQMITTWGVARYFEDDPLQADVIRAACPGCEVVLV